MYMEGTKFDPSMLQKGMRDISNLKGFFKLTVNAAKVYDEWYNDVCPNLEKSAGITGAEGRVHVNVLKVAMNLCVSRKCSLLVDDEDIETAINEVQKLFVNYRRLTLGSGKSKDADPQVKILQTLWTAKDYTLTRGELLSQIWADVSADDLDKVLRTFGEGGLVEYDVEKGKIKLGKAAIDHFRQDKL